MEVTVIGCGSVGSLIVRMLAADPAVAGVRVGTGDLRVAKERLARLPKVRLVAVDAARPGDVARFAAGSALVIQASAPQWNRRVMRAAASVGARYLDLDSHYADYRTPEQFAEAPRFRGIGRAALVQAGVSPGLTNLLAADLAERCGRIEEIRIRVVEDGPGSEPQWSWSPQVAIDEFASPPLVKRAGRFRLTRPFAEPEEVTFPDPIGTRRVYTLFGDEVGTVGRTLRVRDADYKCGGSDVEAGRTLAAFGVLRTCPVPYRGRRVVPARFFAALAARAAPPPRILVGRPPSRAIREGRLALGVYVNGLADGTRKTYWRFALFPDAQEIARICPGATYVAYPTALCAAAFAREVLRARWSGVRTPETLSRAARVRIVAALARQGVRFVERRG